jgi:hypothetical protein
MGFIHRKITGQNTGENKERKIKAALYGAAFFGLRAMIDERYYERRITKGV